MIYTFALILKILFFLPYGLFLPGFLISMFLESDLPFVSSFIISNIILFEIFFLLQILSIPITLHSVLCFLTLLNLAIGFFLFKKDNKIFSIRSLLFNKKIPLFIFLLYFIFFILVFIRLWNAPLLGPDTPFRWNFLAERILKLKNFSFYPPYKPIHFKNYFYPDSIPPMVSFSYLYLYLIAGMPLKSLTSILVLIQILSVLIITFSFTKKLFDSKTALLAQLTLFSIPFLFFFIFIGQEAGYFTLSFISTLYFIYCSKKNNIPILLAGIATSLGILSREYGWLFLICGILTSLILKLNGKKVILYVITACLLSFPWYLRTWILTGNPFYSIPVGNIFNVNPVIAEILITYRKIPSEKIYLFKVLFKYAFIPIFLGIIGCFLFFESESKGKFLLLNIILIFFLWFFSISYTIDELFTLRILLPAIILLCITCAGFIMYLKNKYGKKIYITILTFLMIFFFRSLPFVIFYPFHPSKIPFKTWINYLFFQKIENLGSEGDILNILKNSEFTVSRILTDNAYVHSVLIESEFEAVPIWSPEVYFIYNSTLQGDEIRRRLKELKIDAILYSNRSMNNIYLNKFTFFSLDRKNWKIVEQNEYFTLYFLP